jgi:hypothetical protein
MSMLTDAIRVGRIKRADYRSDLLEAKYHLVVIVVYDEDSRLYIVEDADGSRIEKIPASEVPQAVRDEFEGKKRNPGKRIAPQATSDREIKRRKNRLMNG